MELFLVQIFPEHQHHTAGARYSELILRFLEKLNKVRSCEEARVSSRYFLWGLRREERSETIQGGGERSEDLLKPGRGRQRSAVPLCLDSRWTVRHPLHIPFISTDEEGTNMSRKYPS